MLKFTPTIVCLLLSGCGLLRSTESAPSHVLCTLAQDEFCHVDQYCYFLVTDIWRDRWEGQLSCVGRPDVKITEKWRRKIITTTDRRIYGFRGFNRYGDEAGLFMIDFRNIY